MEALAAFLIALLDQFQARIPGFQPHDAADIHRIATAARYGNDLIPPVITAMATFAPGTERNVFDSDRGKAVLALQAAMLPVARRLLALHDGLLFTVDSQVAEAGTEALQAYAWLKVFAKSPDGAVVRPYVADVAREVKRTQNRRKPAAPPSTSPSTPKPPAAQGFLAPKLASANTAAADDDLPEDFRKALDAASKDDE